MKSSMHNYATKIRNHEKRWVQMQALEMNLQIREHQLKTISYTYRLIYQNSRITSNQKSAIDTQIRKTNSNITLKIVIKPQEERTREEGKKKEQQKQIQGN